VVTSADRTKEAAAAAEAEDFWATIEQ